VPCPFLKRRGHCLKEARCDFLHKRVLTVTSGSKFQWKCDKRSPPYTTIRQVTNSLFLSTPNALSPPPPAISVPIYTLIIIITIYIVQITLKYDQMRFTIKIKIVKNYN
jgi:hypothetical protein